MRRLVDLGRSSPQLALAAVVALLVLGAAAMSYRDAEADLDTFTLDSNVVLSGGTVLATLVGDNDDTQGNDLSSNIYIFGPTANVPNGGNVTPDSTTLPTGLAPQTCTIDAGGLNERACNNPDEPQVCNPNAPHNEPDPATVTCISYGDSLIDDGPGAGTPDNVEESLTATVLITIECETNTAVPITAGDQDSSTVDQTIWVHCLVDPNFTLEKVFEGEPPDQAFTFTYNGPGCFLSIDGVPTPPAPIADGETFMLSNGETAEFFCGPGSHTVTEVDVVIATLDCSSDGADGFGAVGDTEAGTIVLTVPEEDASGVAGCIMENTGIETSTVTVQKICVDAEELEGTFSVALDDGEAVAIECGASVPFEDVEAGTHTLTETIEGADAEDFETVIICGDGVVQEGTEATLEVVAGEDQTCLVINGADITDLICDECPCGCGNEIDIDIDNNNNNTIGIDNSNTNNNANDNDNANFNDNENKNENNNENTNEQNQENTQDQNNSNTQTNNITSSPEVNIDFD